MIGDIFICARCGATHAKGWSDAEAMAEARALTPDDPLIDVVPLCSECHARFVVWLNGLTPERRAEVAAESRAAQRPN